MTIDDVTDILTDGTSDQLTSLAGSGAWYRFSPDAKSMTIGYDGTERRMHKVEGTPACVDILGFTHDFGGK